MIITHTINDQGHRRVYLGGKSSIECWIEPKADGVAWSFRCETSPGRYALPDDILLALSRQILLALADELACPPAELAAVPFKRIAALHMENPSEHRRAASPKRRSSEHGFVASAPGIDRPEATQFNRAHRSGRCHQSPS
jgi:hypothetical protein